MRKARILLMSVLLVGFGSTLLWADTENEKTVLTGAAAWLGLIDNGQYSESWKEASSYFQNAVPEQRWAASLEVVRKPLGRLISRRIVKSQEANSLPGAPDGRYVVMSFSTEFEHKKSAVETVTFMLDEDGAWRAAGYFIR